MTINKITSGVNASDPAASKGADVANAVNALIDGDENTAYIDFTTKPDGLPPSVLDTGQSVDYTFNATGRYPVILNGRLVVNNQAGAGTGSLADYYQSQIGAPVTRIGVEYTLPTGEDTGTGNMTFGVWDGIYEGGGTNVPKSWVHLSIIRGSAGTPRANWSVCNGVGNLFVVKQQYFNDLPVDSSFPWVCEAVLDVNSSLARCTLPDGSVMTVTDADIAYICGLLSIPVITFAELSASVIMCEHFASSGANTAKFAEFKSMWADTAAADDRLGKRVLQNDLMRSLANISSSIPAISKSLSYSPSTQMSVSTATSVTNVDGTNGRIQTNAGPTGKVIIIASAYYEFTADDVLFWRIGGSESSQTRAAFVGVAGQKCVVTQTIEVTGLTAGQPYAATLQHWSAINGSATCKAGGSGSSTKPPLTLLSIPA